MFQRSGRSALSDIVCVELTACDVAKGLVEQTAPTATSDRVCQLRTSKCASSEYQQAAPTPTSGRICRSLSAACDGVAQYEATPAAWNNDRECVDYTVCAANEEFEAVGPTPTSDRICTAGDSRARACSLSTHHTGRSCTAALWCNVWVGCACVYLCGCEDARLLEREHVALVAARDNWKLHAM
jgi:hypothetical protein